MGKHTPGPWKNDDGLVRAADGRCMYESDFGDAEHDADLIAAAPEMLEALKAVSDHLYNPFEPDNQSATYHKTLAIIKKAEGAK